MRLTGRIRSALSGVVVEVHGHAARRRGDDLVLHRRPDLGTDRLLGDAERVEHLQLALGGGPAVAAHRRHDERLGAEVAQPVDRAARQLDALAEPAAPGADGDGHARRDRRTRAVRRPPPGWWPRRRRPGSGDGTSSSISCSVGIVIRGSNGNSTPRWTWSHPTPSSLSAPTSVDHEQARSVDHSERVDGDAVVEISRPAAGTATTRLDRCRDAVPTLSTSTSDRICGRRPCSSAGRILRIASLGAEAAAIQSCSATTIRRAASARVPSVMRVVEDDATGRAPRPDRESTRSHRSRSRPDGADQRVRCCSRACSVAASAWTLTKKSPCWRANISSAAADRRAGGDCRRRSRTWRRCRSVFGSAVARRVARVGDGTRRRSRVPGRYTWRCPRSAIPRRRRSSSRRTGSTPSRCRRDRVGHIGVVAGREDAGTDRTGESPATVSPASAGRQVQVGGTGGAETMSFQVAVVQIGPRVDRLGRGRRSVRQDRLAAAGWRRPPPSRVPEVAVARDAGRSDGSGQIRCCGRRRRRSGRESRRSVVDVELDRVRLTADRSR